MADQAKTIQMIIAGVAGTGVLQLLQTSGICAETNEMHAICQTRFHIIEIVADIDNAVLGKAGCGYSTGQDFAFVAATLGSVGAGGNMIPEACALQAKFGSTKKICGGDSHLQIAPKVLQKFPRAGNGDGFDRAIIQQQFENI